MNQNHTDLHALTADIVGAHVSNNSVAISDLPTLIANVYAALAGLDRAASTPPVPEQGPAVSIRASVKPDYLVCLEDGKKLKLLKRYIMNTHGLTPEAYRAKWKLPADYPMIAPNYAEKRRSVALKIGLGRRDEPAAETPEPVAEPAPPRRRKLTIADPAPEPA